MPDVSIAQVAGDSGANPASATLGVSDSGAGVSFALDHDLKYTLTVEQVRERFLASRRRVPSVRTLQRYGDEGTIAALKIKTMFGNVPGREWLFNEEEVARYIDTQPIIEHVTTAAPPAPPSVDVKVVMAAPASPVASASAATPDVSAPPEQVIEPIGEKRNLAQVLIENARLAAQNEGKDAIINELKEDKAFLREEVREGRKTRDDVKTIAQRMLDVFKTMADGQLAGKLRASSMDDDVTPSANR